MSYTIEAGGSTASRARWPMDRLRNDFLNWYESQRFGVAVALSAVLLALLVSIDGMLGFEPAFRILYVLPLWFSTRLGGRQAGWVLVGLGTWVGTSIDNAHSATTQAIVISTLLHGGALSLIMLAVARTEESLWNARKQALHDPLTGLLNRRALRAFGGEAVTHSRAVSKPLTAVVIDCDDFKKLNDEYGHLAGDHALQILSRVLESETRDLDIVARIGGDEFVILLPGTDEIEARRVMARVSLAFDRRVRDAGYGTSLSVGVASLQDRDPGIDNLLQRADKEMYTDKSRNKGKAYLN